jgi:hypothetical protein
LISKWPSKYLLKNKFEPWLTRVRARQNYYTDNHIGWCARPSDGTNNFVRKGRFKKASNMNYGLDFACRVEEKISELITGREIGSENMPHNDYEVLYDQALNAIIAVDQGKTMAGGNVLLGEIILLVDCDTRVVRISKTPCDKYAEDE